VESREKSRALVEREEVVDAVSKRPPDFFSIFYFHQLKSAPLETA